ncbi:MAG: NotI family restriction endonuclease, partial [Betaproteobacteria bacterium]
KGEFEAFNDPGVDWVIFPAGRRRPDYRSSGPKRLMPQLQIKVPTLRRWGKKMAVVVDRAFFDSIGEMDNVADISNADIAWFVVRFEEVEGQKRTRIVRDEVRYTTLERSVEGLTGGKPVPLPVFETRITDKIVHPVPITEPVEDGLPIENGNGSDAAN